ncbi:MAG: CRISPR-associated helicase Cas3' [Hyphomicrobiaceae bacterium]
MPNEIDRPTFFAFWGKAGGKRPDEPAWHPLVCHSLDVAACADALLEAHPRRLVGLAGLLGTSQENARRFLVSLVALHDVGKFMRDFQAKSEEAWIGDCGVGTVLGVHKEPPPSRHDADGFAMRNELELLSLLGQATGDWVPSDLGTLWAAVTGHHGRPANDGARDIGAFTDWRSLRAANAFARDVCALLGPVAPVPQPPAGHLEMLSWLLCGLTVAADWAGSNRDWFPYVPPPADLRTYWQVAKSRARCAIGHAGLLASLPAVDVAPARLVPDIADRLSPLQCALADCELPDGPLLAIVEDVTGSGKTEAALLLAARLMQSRRADGLYFALPTMATANAMYDRLAAIYGRLYADGARPSLVLSHGKRVLNDRFADSILEARPTDDGYEDGAGATCAAWIADDRRKAFLAQVGVGTIDQALLSVLPSKHQALRLWGLADKVLIIDEAHAYDAYMSREMERLLEFHAALGGSAVVLSATLPAALRHALSAAFAKGLGVTYPRLDVADYPLLTLVSAASQSAQALPTRADRRRTLAVRRLSAIEQAVDHVVEMAARGCAVAWIRNAVDDAIEAIGALEARGLTPVLLHARFAMGDRLDREKEVTRTLGREDATGRRAGFVVVGTQILEQSLDYDVDAMVTDLAPIDLVIQRAGRLWRHGERTARPDVVRELCVLSPDPQKVATKEWLHQISKRTAAVYSHHGIVWRSAQMLVKAEVIDTPGGVRGLVEAVYGPDRFDDIPEPLRAASQQRTGEDSAARSFANANLLKLNMGYGGAPGVWTSDTITPTRLGEEVTVFRLARLEAGRLVPYYADDKPARAWALSEVGIRATAANGVPRPKRLLAPLVEDAKSRWPEWEREMPLLLLETDGAAGWRGVVSMDGTAMTVLYDKRLGLRFA